MIEEEAAPSEALFPPGFWVDEAGGLHADIVKFLAANGIPVTPQNRAALEASLRQSFEQAHPGIQVDVVDWGSRQ